MLLELQGLKRPVKVGVRLGSQEFAMQIRYNLMELMNGCSPACLSLDLATYHTSLFRV